MLLYPPKHFDENEWFVLLTIAAGFIIMALLPKRYPRAMSVLIVLFCVSAAYFMDHAGTSPPLDLYDIILPVNAAKPPIVTYGSLMM